MDSIPYSKQSVSKNRLVIQFYIPTVSSTRKKAESMARSRIILVDFDSAMI